MDLSITLIIVGVTSLISYQAFNNRGLFESLKHYPYIETRENQYYRLLTSGFVHGDMTHLFINMYVLYTFGEVVESLFVSQYGNMGRVIFLLFYLALLVISDIPTHLQHRNNPGFAAIGASGATSGIVFVYVLLDPWQWFIFPPLPGIIMAVGYLAYSSWANKNRNDGIGHSAHFFGAIAGVILSLILLDGLLDNFLSKIVSP